jgi:dienelactone hydrolase
MSSTIVLFHSALGLRPAVAAFADALRAHGHTVHTPDLFDGKVFDDLDDGVRQRDAIGIPGLIERSRAAVEALPAEVVYAGFSMGSASASFLTATRPGARGAILMHGALPPAAFGATWPAGVPAQLHYAEHDPWVDAAEVEALTAAVPRLATFVYPGGGHLFADAGLAEYDEASARLMMSRVLAFLAEL